MARKWLLVFFMVLSVIGVVWAQGTPQPLFVPLQQIGERRPQGIHYDPVYDRLVLVDLQGRLLLADAATYTTQHVLYQRGAYNAYVFSHDGRYLALAIGRRVELWDAQTGELSVTFEPDGANLVQGPLLFSPDDTWLLLDTVVPAPQATRRSENDTDIIPWIWDLPAARDEAPGRLRGGAEAFAFFNYRNGLVLGGNLFLVAGQPNRLQVIDGRSRSFDVITEIPANRAEQDPIYVWHSANSDLMYMDPRTNNQVVQVDAQTGATLNLSLGSDLSYRNLDSMENLRLGESARVLCDSSGLRETPLLRLLYGDEYLRYQNYEPGAFMLIDVLEPLSTGVTQPALLLYHFIESRGRGSLELIYPQDVQQFVLSPDSTHLMVRRQSGVQPIEIYNLDTCGLERTLYPAERDDGSRLLAYRADGEVILTDFQRFDARSGEQLAYEDQYTEPFSEFHFSADGQRLYTFQGTALRVWDVATGQLLQEATLSLNGDVIANSADGTHYLTRRDDFDTITIENVDVLGDERRQLVIPTHTDVATIAQVIPSPGWGRMLLIYQPAMPADENTYYELAVYDFDLGQLLYVAGADLPPDFYDTGWVDDDRIYVSGSNYYYVPDRRYGLEYDTSGLPTCLVNAFPGEYENWLPVWEGLTLQLSASRLGALTERICGALPETSDAFIPGLTPTPGFYYYSANTPAPYVIPGVPTCLTRRFTNQAVDYAVLWREITADLDEVQISQLETMICEGLISSPFQVAATPTGDPNMNIPPTATPASAAPQTTDYTESGATIYYTIDVLTRNRFAGTYMPELVRPVRRDVNLLYNFYLDEFNEPPVNPVLSEDGTRYAVADRYGFVTIYRLSRSYDDLLQDEQIAEATRQAEEPRSIGLLPTATQPFNFIGEVRPTLTPTVTPTPPAPPQATPDSESFGQTTDICPAQTLYTLESPPSGFAVSGRLFAAPPDNGFYSVWVLEPETGTLVADDSLPYCGLGENCTFSPDLNWVVWIADSVIVSRPDGSAATTLFRPEEINYFPQSLRWVNNTQLEYSYPGYLTKDLAAQIRAEQGENALYHYSGQITLTRTFDVTAGARSAPFIVQPLSVSVEGLPTSIVARQPGDGRFVLVSTPYPPYGAKYYIYNLQTDAYDYFTRVDSGTLTASWSPSGRYLYYRLGGDEGYAVFDTETGEHQIIGGLPSGTWSRDGRYRASWYSMTNDEYRARLAAHQLPFKIRIWDSETGSFRRYCIPESGVSSSSGSDFLWSPDGRYLAFTLSLPPEGDVFPVPTPEVGIITEQPATGQEAFPTEPPLPTATLSANMPTASPGGEPTSPPPLPVPDVGSTPVTPITLEQQYQYRRPRTLILDTQTGAVTVISTELNSLLLWTDDGGSR
ncbi:MAG: PD40 domain-containing protein [Anaerolineaceae bacterium]|nr:PD40 domain-containing protein [Anaerolineaceae bacterium]